MENKKLGIKSCGIGLSLSFNQEEFRDRLLESDFIKKYIPSPEIEINCKMVYPRINVTQSDTFDLGGVYPELNYFGRNHMDVLFIAEYMLERARQENGLYSIHSSCVEKDGRAVLFYGWKDTGKTSASLHLAREYGFDFVSEGRTVVNKDFNIAGRIKFLEEDNDFLKESYGFQENCLDISKLCDISSKDAKLSLLVYPQITSQPLDIRVWDRDKNNYHLYEQFSQVIRGVAKNINDYSQPLDSIDTPALARARSDFAKKLSGDIKTYQIRGTLDDICRTVNDLTNNL